MFKIRKGSGLHTWKKNKNKSSSSYKEFICEGCGLVARRYAGETCLTLAWDKQRLERKSIEACKYPKSFDPPGRIKIVNIDPPYNPVHFKNVKPGSTHHVVKPPGHYYNDEAGVWINGYGTLVKIWAGEYTPLKATFNRKAKKVNGNRFKRKKKLTRN